MLGERGGSGGREREYEIATQMSTQLFHYDRVSRSCHVSLSEGKPSVLMAVHVGGCVWLLELTTVGLRLM